QVPVVNEADVLHVLPLIGSDGQTLFEQGDCQIGPPWATRIRLRQKHRPEAVRDIETWVERGRQVEEWIQQPVVLIRRRGNERWRLRRKPLHIGETQFGRTVMLNRADPIEIGGE